MAELSSFFKSIGGDRKYTADRFAEYFRSFLTSGIFNGGDNLLVFNTGTDNKTYIKPGKAWINGYFYFNTSEFALTHDTADTVNDRIDRIVLRLNLADSARNIKAHILKGIPDPNPIAKDLTRNDEVYEISLAKVLIPANTLIIPQENITDERLDTESCGLVNSLIKVDTSTMQQEFDQFMDGIEGEIIKIKLSEEEPEFDSMTYWYRNLGSTPPNFSLDGEGGGLVIENAVTGEVEPPEEDIWFEIL